MLAEPTVAIYRIEGYSPTMDPPLRRTLKEMERREGLLKVQWRILREEGRLIVIIMHLKERSVEKLAYQFERRINALMRERGEGGRLKTILVANITRSTPTPEEQYLLERFLRVVRSREIEDLPGEITHPDKPLSLLVIYTLYLLGSRSSDEITEDLYPLLQLEIAEVEGVLSSLLEDGFVKREGEKYWLTWEGLSLIEEISGEEMKVIGEGVVVGDERYLLHPSGRIERFDWGSVVEELIFSGVSFDKAVEGVKTALKNLPGEKYVPAGYLFWELKQILDSMDPTGRLSTKYAFYKEPEIYLTLEREGRRYPVTRDVLMEEVLKRLPRGKYVCGSDVVENVVEHLYSVIRHINMETVPTSFFQEDQEIPLSGEELDRIVESFVRRYLPYYDETRALEPSEAALGVLKGTMHYFHRSEVLLESDPETSLKYLLKAFKTLVEAELLASGVQPTFSFSRNMRMLRRLHERAAVERRVIELYDDVLSLYRRFKRKRTILERDEDLIARGQSRAKEMELYLKGVSGASKQKPCDPSDRV